MSWKFNSLICFALLFLVTQPISGFDDEEQTVNWHAYEAEAFSEYIEEGQVVVLLFHADWCLTCATMKHALSVSEELITLSFEGDVVFVSVNVTDRDDKVTGELLAQYSDTNSIPLIVIEYKDVAPIVLEGVTTAEELLANLDL